MNVRYEINRNIHPLNRRYIYISVMAKHISIYSPLSADSEMQSATAKDSQSNQRFD